MPNREQCPGCGKSMVVHGTIFRRSGSRPEGLKLFSMSFRLPEVPVPNKSAACGACGLVWSQLDAASLPQKVRGLVNDEVEKLLEVEFVD